jgi:hypothetical protein
MARSTLVGSIAIVFCLAACLTRPSDNPSVDPDDAGTLEPGPKRDLCMALEECGQIGALTVEGCVDVAESCMDNANDAQEEAWDTNASGCAGSGDCDTLVTCYQSLPCYEEEEETLEEWAALHQRLDALRSGTSPDR